MTHSSPWPEGKRCAVSLTYDDAMDCHWQEVAPELEKRGFRGTFYTPLRPSLWNQVEKWRAVAQAGHELGNHTVFHPCRRSADAPSYEAFDRYDLSRYTLDEFRNELAVANAFLQLIDGRSKRTYGNTCHNTTVGRGEEETSITPVLGEFFPAARGGRRRELVGSDLAGLDRYEVGCVSSHVFAELRQALDATIAVGGWVIICLHGVADQEGRLMIARSEHEAMLNYLFQNEGFWVAPVVDVVERLAPPQAG